VLSRWLGNLRFWGRLAAFVVVTLFLWASMELDFLLRRRTPRITLINKWVPRWSAALCWIFGFKVEAHGPYIGEGKLYPGCDDRGVGRIFVMNHRSGVDIPVTFILVAAHVISRHDLANWPLIGPGARRIGTLFVDRASTRSGADVLRKVADSLEKGEGISMFPEGTAYAGDEVRAFRPGAFKAAQRAGAQVVPLGIAYENPQAYYVSKSFMEHMKRIASFKSLRIVVEAGEPMTYDEDSPVEFKDHVRQRVVELVAAARRRLGGAEQVHRHMTASTAGGSYD
jgi:1-acyl-sn-glycerol-3-phosphate acyltransferase